MLSLKKLKPIHRGFLYSTIILLAIGLGTFMSTALSVFAENTSIFYNMLFSQLVLGIVGGLGAMWVCSRIDYRIWQKFAPWILGFSALLTLLVFIPGLGIEHGGARRWISLGFVSFQPAEILKFGIIVFLSSWFATFHKKMKTWKYGLLPFVLAMMLVVILLFRQPDSGTILIIGLVSFIMYLVNGASWKHVGIVIAGGAAFLALYVSVLNPYILDRIQTFINPQSDPFGSSYQVRQSLTAIGSGKIMGRGLGRGLHKFGSHLPEPAGDSVFAVYAEEYGFIGSFALIFFYMLFTIRGFKIARFAPSIFSQNLVLGLVLLVMVQVFFNIAGISGLVPLSGLPLIFMSHGGTALFLTLAEIGIILNISRSMREPKKLVQ